MRACSLLTLAATVAVAGSIGIARPAAAQTPLTTVRVAAGLAGPVAVTYAPGDFSRIFVVEKRSSGTGRIRIVNIPANTLNVTPFLLIAGLATADAEQGLLGLAFHPNYQQNGYFYVNYTLPGGAFGNGVTYIQRYTRSAGDPNVADPASALTLLTIDKPQTNHNCGWLGFGPDGYLYIATGDGGNGGDMGNGHTPTIGNAQDLSKLLGKILRIDVNSADPGRNYHIPATNPFVGVSGVQPEIFMYGCRNPWRDDFDPVTGDMFIADVGQDLWEEINFIPAGTGAGRNLGWHCYEGTATYSTTDCPAAATMTFPFLVYGHATSVPPTNATGCAVMGGAIYRGCAIPDLSGTYFFADYCSSKIFSLRYNGSTLSNFTDRTAELDPPGTLAIQTVQSFGRDAFGELYICDANGGEVYKIVPASPVGPDCNANGRRDACDILAGSSRDFNHDGIPDSCHCPADWDGNGLYEPADIAAFVNVWSSSLSQGTLAGDYDNNGSVQPSDVAAFVNAWFSAISTGSC